MNDWTKAIVILAGSAVLVLLVPLTGWLVSWGVPLYVAGPLAGTAGLASFAVLLGVAGE